MNLKNIGEKIGMAVGFVLLVAALHLVVTLTYKLSLIIVNL